MKELISTYILRKIYILLMNQTFFYFINWINVVLGIK